MKNSCFFFLMLLAQTSNAQQDTTVDVFPLAIGNRWAYRFNSGWRYSGIHLGVTDTGIVQYTIIGVSALSDSTRWQFYQVRDFNRYVLGNPYPVALRDSGSFEIVEMNTGHHEIYTPVFDVSSAFPLLKSFADSSRFFRFEHVDSIGSIVLRLPFPDPSGNYHCTLSLHKDTGLVMSTGFVFTGYPAAGSYHWETHYLQQYVRADTTTAVSVAFNHLDQYVLEQNYPNPFNPRTTINFAIPVLSKVRLTVFDMLGRCVATLVNETMKPGTYHASFDGTNLSSGTYLCRLETERFSKSTRLLLLR